MHQITLALGRLLGQNVGVEGVLPFDFPGTRQLETLLGCRVGFLLWHDSKNDRFAGPR